LSVEEKQEVRAVLNSERFCDSSPRAVYATLLDEEGIYLCHWRTMYRVLEEHDEVRERRRQGRQPKRAKPELRATGPNEVWSWDIMLWATFFGQNKADRGRIEWRACRAERRSVTVVEGPGGAGESVRC
jgi:transposase InsO family protein